MTPLHVAQRSEDEVAVVALEGRIVLGDGDQQLADTVRSLVAEGRRQIVLDLTQVSYVDSAGIGALVSAYTTVTSAGGRLALAGLQKRIAELLDVTKLLTVFPTYRTPDEAVAALRG